MSEQTLVVFTNNGHKYYFYGVYNFMLLTTGFTFNYKTEATGMTLQAAFNNTSVVGYAFAKE